MALTRRQREVLDVIHRRIERFLPGHSLLGLVGDLRHIIDVAGQIIAIPERHQKPDKACCDEDVIGSHHSVQGPFTKISVRVKCAGITLAASDKAVP